MDIEYLSHAEAAQFGEMVHSNSELAELFSTLVVQMEVDTDYDCICISFDDPDVLRIVVRHSPYVIVMDEEEQLIELYVRDDDDDEELLLDGEYDFDEDGVETVVDVMASRVLTGESDGF